MPFTHHLRVRYAEVDAQGVVFNAHWLTYADDATTRFFEPLGYDPATLWSDTAAPFDIMVRASSLDFAGAVHFDEEVAIDVAPTRLGSSSFDLRYAARVGDRPAVTITSTYVVVVPGEQRSQPIPDELRARLERDLVPAGGS